MAQSGHGISDERIEQILGNLLRAGVILAALVVLAGCILYLVRHGNERVQYDTFHGEVSSLTSVQQIIAGVAALRARAIIQFGLLLLIATPVARVVFSVFAFAWQRDYTYVILTLVVLAILFFSFVSGGEAGSLTDSPYPKARTVRNLEGWTVRVDDRLLEAPDDILGKRALRFLENKLADIKVVVREDRLKKLQSVAIVLDLTHGKLRAMQYHPSAGWLKANGYAVDLVKCVHIPRAADLPTRRNINEQPWVILHELAHAYHDQVLSFDEPRVREAYERYKQSGRGDKTLLYNGKRVRHYALTNRMEFFAEMTEAYFGVNDFFPFNRAELQETEPDIYSLLAEIWDAPRK